MTQEKPPFEEGDKVVRFTENYVGIVVGNTYTITSCVKRYYDSESWIVTLKETYEKTWLAKYFKLVDRTADNEDFKDAMRTRERKLEI